MWQAWEWTAQTSFQERAWHEDWNEWTVSDPLSCSHRGHNPPGLPRPVTEHSRGTTARPFLPSVGKWSLLPDIWAETQSCSTVWDSSYSGSLSFLSLFTAVRPASPSEPLSNYFSPLSFTGVSSSKRVLPRASEPTQIIRNVKIYYALTVKDVKEHLQKKRNLKSLKNLHIIYLNVLSISASFVQHGQKLMQIQPEHFWR